MEYKNIIITGFDPFNGGTMNPSWEAVNKLPEIIGQYQLTKMKLPTIYDQAAQQVINKAEMIHPDAIICVGQAAGRRAITPEVIGINLKEASIPDNAGQMFTNTPIDEDGPAAYFSTLPVRDIVEAIRHHEIPCSLSYSAGAFVCNNVLYTLLHHFHHSEIFIGFIHVPLLPEQAKPEDFSMPLDQMVKALEIAIKTLP